MRPHCLSLSDRQRALIQSAAASIPGGERRETFIKQIVDQLRGQRSDLAVAAAINNALDRVYAFDNNNTCN